MNYLKIKQLSKSCEIEYISAESAKFGLRIANRLRATSICYSLMNEMKAQMFRFVFTNIHKICKNCEISHSDSNSQKLNNN